MSAAFLDIAPAHHQLRFDRQVILLVRGEAGIDRAAHVQFLPFILLTPGPDRSIILKGGVSCGLRSSRLRRFDALLILRPRKVAGKQARQFRSKIVQYRGRAARHALDMGLSAGRRLQPPHNVRNATGGDTHGLLGECPDRRRGAGIADGHAESAAVDHLKTFGVVDVTGSFCGNPALASSKLSPSVLPPTASRSP